MNFANYLFEAADEKISADDFIESIKEKGLYGYDVLKHFTEDELRSKITDDSYFKSNETSGDNKESKIEEMVLRNNPNDKSIDNDKEVPKGNELSLAVRLGLKKKVNPNDVNSDTTGLNTKYTFGKKPEEPKEKPKPQSFADKMREFAEQKRKEQLERVAKEKELRDQRAKEAEESSKKEDQPELTFNGKSQVKQGQEDDKTVDRKLADIEKELEKEMFKKTRASTKVDDDGYKSVKNLSRITDAEYEKKLSKEMTKKFPSQEVLAKKKLGNSDQSIASKEAHIMSRNEYSKRTLLAVSDKLSGNFNVYCKYRKLNGDIRTGDFRIGETKSQITNKQSTLICQDLDLSKKENKVVWRTINLFKILEIKPL